MIASRGCGLDCGPMSGFDADAIEKEFFAGSGFKINFICNLGYRDGKNPYPRLCQGWILPNVVNWSKMYLLIVLLSVFCKKVSKDCIFYLSN